MKTLIKTLLLVILSSQLYAQNNYYWVGNSGNWSEFATHWATTSGGSTFYTQTPTAIDQVIFDANSFTLPSQTANIDIALATCNNITWTGVTNSPTFNGNGNTLSMNGSLTFDAGMLVTALNTSFDATSTGKTITSAGKSLASITFNGIGGAYTLQDNLTVSGSILLNNGAFDTNNFTVNAGSFFSNNSNVRAFTLGTSTLNLSNGAEAWSTNNTSNFTFSGASAIINFTGSNSNGQQLYAGNNSNTNPALIFNILNFTGANAGIYFGPIIANTVTFTGNCLAFAGANVIGNLTVAGSFSQGSAGDNGASSDITNATFGGFSVFRSANTFGTLNLTGLGANYTFPANLTQTINTALNVPNASCGNYNYFLSSISGVSATISKATGNVTVDFVGLKDITATGGATFIANDAINLGNNTGWTINTITPKTYYWVGNSGNWNNGANWSLTSNGLGAGCPPTPVDNVIFDANSFSLANRIVYLDTTLPTCNDITWTGVTNSPIFDGGGRTLKIYGSSTFDAGMSVTDLNASFEATSTGKTITSAGKSLASITFNGIGGAYTLQDNLTVSGSILLNNGAFDTNNFTVNAGSFSSNNSNVRAFTLGTSTLNLSNGAEAWSTNNTSNFTFSGASSIINFTGSNSNGQQLYAGNNSNTNPALIFNILNFTGADAGIYFGPIVANSVNFSGNCLAFAGANVINNLTVAGTFAQGSAGDNGASSNFTNATFGGTSIFKSANTFGTLNMTGIGASYTFPASLTQTINTALNIPNGTTLLPNSLKSNTSGTQSTLSMANVAVCVDYAQIQDINITGSNIYSAGPNSQNISNNTGWNFIVAGPAPSINIASNIVGAVCLGTTFNFTVSAISNEGANPTYNWKVNDVSVQNGNSNTFSISSLTNGSTVKCELSNHYSGSCNFSVLTNSNTINAILTPDNTVVLSSSAGTDAQSLANNTAITNITYTTTGATNASFSGLPTGVSGNWTNNVITISGTPSVQGLFNYTATLTGGCNTITANGSITVNAALPVNLISYQANLENDGTVKLNWATASESNNDHFLIDVSNDGIDFRQIASILGAGTTSNQNKYVLFDRNPSKGINYYRLKQFDRDGKSQELGIKSVNLDIEQNVKFVVYPNPFVYDINFMINHYAGKQIKLALINLNGEVLQQETIITNSSETNYKFNINKYLPMGQYLLRVTGTNLEESLKIIKRME